jgi:transcriptional regulator with XRE-family HTH domain
MPPVKTVKPNGAALRRLREERGIRVPDLARKLGRHPQSIWNLEGPREAMASVIFMRQIAKALDVKYAEIVRAGADDDEPERVAA